MTKATPNVPASTRHPQPSLVASVSEDDDEEEAEDYASESLVQSVRDRREDSREALAYLLRYETMIRQQEAEDMATLAHVRPCIERLEELAGISDSEVTNTERRLTDSALLAREVPFSLLKLALEELENKQRERGDHSEFMTTDRQLMMVLRLLSQKVDTTAGEDVCISWAEFFQAYKVCIVGMLSLQHLPAGSAVRQRARDRTLAMMSLFESPSTKLFWNAPPVDSTALTLEARRTGAATHITGTMPAMHAQVNRKPLPAISLGLSRGRTGRRLVFIAMAALTAILVLQAFGPESRVGKKVQGVGRPNETTENSPLQESSARADFLQSASTVKQPSTLQNDHLLPYKHPTTPFRPRRHSKKLHSLHSASLSPESKSVRSATLAPTAQQSASIVGGLAGLLVAPLAVPQVFASFTLVNVGLTAVFGAGLVSVATMAVESLRALFRRVATNL